MLLNMYFQDRVIFHRLEHVCYTIEHGEWPFARRPPQAFFPPGTPTHADSRSETPVSAVMKSDSATGAESDQSEGVPSSEVSNKVMMATGSDVTSDRELHTQISPEVGQTCYPLGPFFISMDWNHSSLPLYAKFLFHMCSYFHFFMLLLPL